MIQKSSLHRRLLFVGKSPNSDLAFCLIDALRMAPSDEGAVANGDWGRENYLNALFFSPSVSFADSSLIRGSLLGVDCKNGVGGLGFGGEEGQEEDVAQLTQDREYPKGNVRVQADAQVGKQQIQVGKSYTQAKT